MKKIPTRYCTECGEKLVYCLTQQYDFDRNTGKRKLNFGFSCPNASQKTKNDSGKEYKFGYDHHDTKAYSNREYTFTGEQILYADYIKQFPLAINKEKVHLHLVGDEVPVKKKLRDYFFR